MSNIWKRAGGRRQEELRTNQTLFDRSTESAKKANEEKGERKTGDKVGGGSKRKSTGAPLG